MKLLSRFILIFILLFTLGLTSCDDGGETCSDDCTLGETRCEGTAVQTCSAGADGCTEWQTTVDCVQTDRICNADTGTATCITGCPQDADCDEVLTADDCDDADPTLGAEADDGDCDGALTADDCDDADATLGAVADDGDCDGVLTADDCDDADASLGAVADDGDCDRSLTLLDCDDTDPAVQEDALDADCDGIVDYVVFQKLDGADAYDPANQDCIVAEVCITRGDTGGLFNATVDESYSEGDGFSTPTGVEFAQGFMGQGQEFVSWRESIPITTWWVMQPMAMRLIDSGLEFNVVPWHWTAAAQGGGFGWARAPVKNFEKLDLADPSDLANQDCVVPGVCLTRADTQSLYNAAVESQYGTGSPAGTEWAPVATRDAAPGSYASFVTATGGQPQDMIGQVMSLHIVGTSIYYDVVITAWSGGGAGGGFAWTRSRALVVGCPDPTAANYDERATVDDGYCGDWVRFEVPSDPDTLDPANWDCVTPEVCITRGSSQGLFNAASEPAYDDDEYLSPLGTFWAPSATSDATTLDYVTWREAIDSDPPEWTYRTLSLFIPADSLFYDVVVLRWPAGSGGGFVYVRRQSDVYVVCGDGILQLGEECDDSNTDPGDGCQPNCRMPVCGDSIVDPGETCDEGLQNSDEPGATCRTNCVAAGCNDGILDSGEVCDDGNLIDGDGCDTDCDLSCGRGSGAERGLIRASDGACLLFYSTRKPFHGAMTFCGTEGGTLVTVNDGAENQIVSSWSEEMAAGIWIGFTDELFEGSWGWVSGATSTFTSWNDGEPNDSGSNEDCGETGSGGGWNDAACANSKPFVCETLCGNAVLDAGEECDDGAANSNAVGSACRRNCRVAAACGDGILDAGEDCDDGNIADFDGCQPDCTLPCGVGLGAALTNLSPTDGACFLAFDTLSTYAEAQTFCEALGGQLATISDADENDAILAILSGAGDGAWIGVNDRANEGVFAWLDGTLLSYTNWALGEPNDYYGVEDCGQIYAAGLWNDNQCQYTYGFFCEIQP